MDTLSVSPSHTADHGFASQPCKTKDHHKNGTNCNVLGNVLGLKFGSAA